MVKSQGLYSCTSTRSYGLTHHDPQIVDTRSHLVQEMLPLFTKPCEKMLVPL